MTEEITIESVQALMVKKAAIEADIESTRSWLLAPGNLGLSGGLIDEEGFPINDFDKIVSTREARHKLACLQNDHIEIMEQIEKGLAYLHLKAREAGTPAESFTKPVPSSSSTQLSEVDEEKYSQLTPFVTFSAVLDQSPAWKSGIRDGDLGIEMAGITKENGGLDAFAPLVAQHADKDMAIIVKRKNENNGGADSFSYHKLTLKPSKWTGRGLLGCGLTKI